MCIRDRFKTYTVDELNSMYDLLSSMKSTDIQSELYAAGAALEHNLNLSLIHISCLARSCKTDE